MKIKFIKLAKKHLEQVRCWRNSPAIKKYMYTETYIGKQRQLTWYRKIIKDKSKKYWIIRVNGQDIGVTHLTDIDLIHKHCSWGLYIGEDKFRGKGIGTQTELNILHYTFKQLKLNKLSCEVLITNEVALRLHKKCGFKIEGTLRSHIYKKGKFYDVVILSILKNEWQKVKKNFEILLATIEE